MRVSFFFFSKGRSSAIFLWFSKSSALFKSLKETLFFPTTVNRTLSSFLKCYTRCPRRRGQVWKLPRGWLAVTSAICSSVRSHLFPQYATPKTSVASKSQTGQNKRLVQQKRILWPSLKDSKPPHCVGGYKLLLRKQLGIVECLVFRKKKNKHTNKSSSKNNRQLACKQK